MPAATWNDVVKATKAKMPTASLKEVLKAASPEWKRIKSGENPTKGMASLTMPGKEDFSTKKTSKVFHRKGHYEDESAEGVKRRPYHGVGKRKSRKQGKKGPKTVSKLPMSESVLVVEESPMAGGQAAAEAAPQPDEATTVSAETDVSEVALETTGAKVDDPATLIAAPGMTADESQPSADASAPADASADASADAQQQGGRRRRGKKGRKHGKKTAKKSRRHSKKRMGGRRKTSKRSRRH